MIKASIHLFNKLLVTNFLKFCYTLKPTLIYNDLKHNFP